MGDSMDGMDDMNDAPMPPMGADDNIGMDDNPLMDDEGMAPPMDDDENQDPMGDEDMSPMDDNGDTPINGEDDELMDIINNLSIEDKAAVVKYAKSMTDDSKGDDNMPMESKRNMRDMIDEVINDVLDDKEGTKRPEKKMPKAYRNMEMPFKSPF